MQSRRVRRTRSGHLGLSQHAASSPVKAVRRPLTRFTIPTKASGLSGLSSGLSPRIGSVDVPVETLTRSRSRTSSNAIGRNKQKTRFEARSNGKHGSPNEQDRVTDNDSEGSYIDENDDVAKLSSGRGASGINRPRSIKRRRLESSSKVPGKVVRAVRGIRTRSRGPVILGDSPRKRKRDDPEYSDDDDMADGEVLEEDATPDEEGLSPGLGDVRMLEDVDETEEPEFIAEADQHLLQEASAAALHRLRKADLIRLWKVAGLWEGPDEEDSADDGHDMGEEIRKNELVGGIIATRRRPILTPTPSSSERHHLSKMSFISRQSSHAKSTAQSSPHHSDPSSSETSEVGDRPHFPFPKYHSMKAAKTPIKARNNRRPTPDSSAPSSVSGSDADKAARRPATRKQARTPVGRRQQRSVSFDHKNSGGSSNAAADDEDTGDQGSGEEETSSEAAVDTSEKRRTRSMSGQAGPSSGAQQERVVSTRKAKRQALQAIKSTGLNQRQLDDAAGGPMSDASFDGTVGDPTPRPKHVSVLNRNRDMPSHVQSPSQAPPTMQNRQRLTRSRASSFAAKLNSKGRDHLGDDDLDDQVQPDQSFSDAGESSHQARRLRRSQPGRSHRPSSLERGLESMDICSDEVAQNAAEPADDAMEEENEQMELDESLADFDLGAASESDLARLKKDQLVQMCLERDLDTEATKKELIRYLLSWREAVDGRKFRSPSSTSTARPASSPSQGGKSRGAKPEDRPISVPRLLQGHPNVADPHTPQHSQGEVGGAVDNEGALDLEELGLEEKEIPESQIQKGEKIGSGGFKDVYIGKYKNRTKVAICEFRGELGEMDIREIKLLAEFNHPNIVRLLGICVPESPHQAACMVITELCEKGDMFDYIRNAPAPPFAKILRMMIDIARGLEYLHERKPRVIHRDCKSSNIMINSRGVCKVGDFGLARVKSTARSVLKSTVGTCQYQSPELWHPKPRYDYKVDVYSCSMVFWEMLSGWASDRKLYPWEGKNEHWIYENVGRKGLRPATFNVKKTWGSDIVELLERMWQEDPNERPTMTNVVEDLQAILENVKKGTSN